MTRFTSSWSTMAVCSPPSPSNELFYDLSPSTIPMTADGPFLGESSCHLPLRSTSDVEETFTPRKCSLDGEEKSGNDLDTVPKMLCQSSNQDPPQTSDVHPNQPYADADSDTEMTSNDDSTSSVAGSPPSSSSTAAASPTSSNNYFKAPAGTPQAPYCCNHPRIATRAPQAAPLSSTLPSSSTNTNTSPPSTTTAEASSTTTPYRFCTSCDTFMGFCPAFRRKSSILEPIIPVPPAAPPFYTQNNPIPPPHAPGQMRQQQQRGAPPGIRGSQRPGGSMAPPPRLPQRKRALDSPFEGPGGGATTKSVRRWVSPDFFCCLFLLV